MYPYEYMNSFKTFSDYKLPDRCEFLSSLEDEYVSEKDYLHSIDDWIMFKMNTIGDYHDLYLKTNVLLLADVFEKFIDMCLEYYGLDLCHYFSSPGLSWYTKLKMAKIELELVSDISLFLFNEKGMRRGISYIAKKCSQVNNKYMEFYGNRKPSKYIYHVFRYKYFVWLGNGSISSL